MCIAVVGGIKGIEHEYKKIAEENKIKIKVFNQMVNNFQKRIKNIDGIILFTDTTSHKLAGVCCNLCKKNNIILKRPHSSSITKLQESIDEIKNDLISEKCKNCKICK